MSTPEDELLHVLTDLLKSKAGLKDFMEHALDKVIEKVEAERGYILLLDSQNEFNAVFARSGGRDLSQESLELSRSIARKVIDSDQPLVLENAFSGKETERTKSIATFRLLSVMAVPFRFKEKIIGVIYVDNRLVTNLFNKDKLALLESLSQTISNHFEINMHIASALSTISGVISKLGR